MISHALFSDFFINVPSCMPVYLEEAFVPVMIPAVVRIIFIDRRSSSLIQMKLCVDVIVAG